jgi:heat shock protein HslJ
MRSMSRRLACIACLIAAPAAALAAPGATAPPKAQTAPGEEQLANLAYSGIGSGGPVTLRAGRYENTKARRSVTLARGFRVTGDLDGDGRDEAVVLLAENTGGSGTFDYFAVAGVRKGKVVNVATVALGDRVQVRDARIEARRLVAEVVRAGPQDAMCCPGELATLAWELRAGKLTPVPTGTKPGRLSLAAIEGAEWVLRSWSWNEPVTEGIEITLEVSDDRVAGRAACNRYFAPATAGEPPGDVSIGAASSTRMACPEPQMAAESRFLARLATVRRFSFVAGQLALSWNQGDQVGTMLFARKGRNR